jgi:hypothetical protein
LGEEEYGVWGDEECHPSQDSDSDGNFSVPSGASSSVDSAEFSCARRVISLRRNDKKLLTHLRCYAKGLTGFFGMQEELGPHERRASHFESVYECPQKLLYANLFKWPRYSGTLSALLAHPQ